jgi:hypothetical protein
MYHRHKLFDLTIFEVLTAVINKITFAVVSRCSFVGDITFRRNLLLPSSGLIFKPVVKINMFLLNETRESHNAEATILI